MTELYYGTIGLCWILLFLFIWHTHGYVKEHAIRCGVPMFVALRQRALVITSLIVFGSIITFGVHQIYTLHLIAMA